MLNMIQVSNNLLFYLLTIYLELKDIYKMKIGYKKVINTIFSI